MLGGILLCNTVHRNLYLAVFILAATEQTGRGRIIVLCTAYKLWLSDLERAQGMPSPAQMDSSRDSRSADYIAGGRSDAPDLAEWRSRERSGENNAVYPACSVPSTEILLQHGCSCCTGWPMIECTCRQQPLNVQLTNRGRFSRLPLVTGHQLRRRKGESSLLLRHGRWKAERRRRLHPFA